MFLVHRHDLTANIIAGSMQGDGKSNLERLISEVADARHEAAGGDRHLASSKADTPRGIQDFDSLHEVPVVGHWLAHPHEDEVIDPLTGDLLGEEDLADDLIGSQVALPSVKTTRAELAPVGTADLGGDTKGATVGFLSVERGRRRDEDRLDELAVMETQKELAGRVFRTAYGDHFSHP